MLHRSGEMGKKPNLNNFIFIVKIPNLEPKVFTLQCNDAIILFFILTLNLLLRMISNFSAKQMPFKVNFTSDGFESQQEAMTPPSPNQNDKGFKLSYYQVGC